MSAETEVVVEKKSRRSSDSIAKSVKQKVEQNPSKVYNRPLDSLGRSYGTGRGKGYSVARVWLSYSDDDSFTVNSKEAAEYFPRESWMKDAKSPLATVSLDNGIKYKVMCTVKGGGLSGQVRAIKLGLARALVGLNPDVKPVLKEMKLLTRDARCPERKKPGLYKARTRPPYKRR